MNDSSSFDPKIALFDFDGTLVHHCYEPFFDQVIQFLSVRGYPGLTYEDLWRDHRAHRFMSCVPDHERTRLIDAFLHQMDESKLPSPTLIAETHQTLQTLHDAGIRIAVVTARLASPEDLRPLIGELGILDYISHVSTRGPQAPEWRDKSEQITQVCKHFGIKTAHSCMVGDMPVDIKSAHAAGAGCAIGVLSGGVDRSVLEACKPHHLIEHVGEIPRILPISQKR